MIAHVINYHNVFDVAKANIANQIDTMLSNTVSNMQNQIIMGV